MPFKARWLKMAKSNTSKDKTSASEADSGIGGIQNPAKGLPPGTSNCPEGQFRDATSGDCVPIEGDGSMAPETPKKVIKDGPAVSGGVTNESLAAEEASLKELKTIREKLEKILSPSAEADDDNDDDDDKDKMSKEGKANADLASERKRTEEYHRLKQLAELKAEIEANELKLQAQEQVMRKAKLISELKSAKESSLPHFKTGTEKYDLATEVGVLRPAQWFASVRNEENVMPSHIYHINKQGIFDTYGGRYLTKVGQNWAPEQAPFPDQYRQMMSATEAISGPPANDFMRIMSEQVLVMPNGKVVTPIRQFCEVKVLPPGTKEAFFFDYGSVNFQAITEGNVIPDSTMTVRSSGGSTAPVGARVQIPFSAIEETPIDLVTANNRSFALESVNSEQVEVLTNTYNVDTGSSGDGTNRKAKGGGTKDGRWVNGNDGTALTTGSDDSGLGSGATLSYKGLLAGKQIIEQQGLDVANLILYTSIKSVNDIIQDPNLDSYLSFSRPEVITEGVVEKVAGINIVKTSACAPLAAGGVATGVRAVLFIPGVAFGLVSGRDLTMEAQRRNETQVVHLTGTQKIAGFTKIVEATCRISIA